MPQFFFTFAAGVFVVSFLQTLPVLWLLLLSFSLLLPGCQRKTGKLLAGFCAGLCWGTLCGAQLLRHQLPVEFELREFVVEGTVVGLPEHDQQRSRFQLQVQSCRELAGTAELPLRKVLLSWYQHDIQLQPGQRWRLRAKLRRPRGFANPGGFNYRQWLLQQNISATGYVRDSLENRLLGHAPSWPDAQRAALLDRLGQVSLPVQQQAILQALVIGDGRVLSVADWSLFNNTGTTHLMVISGLHIGLFALLCYAVGSLLGRLANLLVPALPAVILASCCSLVGAFFYTGLSGFGLPATRALAMVAVVLAARVVRGHITNGSGLSVALAVVAVVDPLAAHSPGFWMSFGAVFALLWVFTPTVGSNQGWRRYWNKLWRPQWVVFVALSTVLLASFGKLPLLSVPINGLAIPWVSLFIVPLSLLGVGLIPISAVAVEFCWRCAGWQLQQLYELLSLLQERTQHLGFAHLTLSTPITWTLLTALLVGALLILMPRGVPGRWVGALPLLFALSSNPTRPAIAMTVLDVGQGLAVVVTTTNHTLVYDTGARFGRRFNAGSGVIAPFLQEQGITKVDRLLVSHADNDHAGGLEGLLRSVLVTDIWSGEPLEHNLDTTFCQAGMRWSWDGVLFEVLSPFSGQLLEGNNSSCVLLVTVGSRRILLPGDIEAGQEQQLLQRLQGELSAVDVLVAPHHGSKTSSIKQFVNVLNPDHVIYSAGYRHHFGHPHKSVVERYREAGSKQWNTADSGALSFVLHDGMWQVSEYRRQQRYFWSG